MKFLYKPIQARTKAGNEASPALFWNLQKSVLILGNNTVIVFIYGLNLSFEMQI